MDAETKRQFRELLRRDIKLLTHQLKHCENGEPYAITNELLERSREHLYSLRETPVENRRLSRLAQLSLEWRAQLRREAERFADMGDALKPGVSKVIVHCDSHWQLHRTAGSS